jgi:tetratricopeptide (TPR) repeat protein
MFVVEFKSKKGYTVRDGGMVMDRVAVRDRLLADLNSGNDSAGVSAALELLALGDYGDPVGTYLLQGGKAALRKDRLADAVVLLYHGARVAHPGTLLWGELLVNRALACCRFGYCPDAIKDGSRFLESVDELPLAARAWIPHAHHAIAQGYDRMRKYDRAVPHHRAAADGFADPTLKANSQCSLAYSLAISDQAGEAERVLAGVHCTDLPEYYQFVHAGTRAIVLYHLGRFDESLEAGETAERLARGHEDEWVVPVAEVRYWMSRSAWRQGDRYRSAALALDAAVRAESRFNMALRDMAADWLEQILDQGGIQGA